ncbi:MAG: 16S rRNA (cytosine(1402)-N(4))-methyltransferase [Acidobacteria bacterium SCN 69-37]|nr:MAG: 16S rRNA (cytosine(1402)-N(4))-methyltransferase [Acidobacteria bacterium SCN 69-37]
MTTPGPSRSTASDDARHAPVLASEVLELLAPRPGGVYVDCTLGAGGHTRRLVAAGAGLVIGIDRDASALDVAREALGEAATAVAFVHDDYRHLPAVLAARGVTTVDGVVADLGVSSMQIDDAARGFSFRQAGPLDMRMDRDGDETLADRLATVDETTLADVIWRFGEERHSRRVARAIVAARDRGDLVDTAALASVVRRAAGGGTWQRIDPATRTFQALRIWVNAELDGLEAFLESAATVLAPGGRLAVIAFHSLEDRVVKHTFRRLAADRDRWQIVTRRPVVPGDEECGRNPRARSARLRVLERVA